MKKIYFLIIIGALFAFGSCRKSFFDVNNNPNSPTEVSVDKVLAAPITNVAAILSPTYYGRGTGTEEFAFWMGYWGESGSYAPDIPAVSYTFPNSYYTDLWSHLYLSLSDLDYVEKAAHADGHKFYEGIAKIMKTVAFHELVDVYGNIPYTQALQVNTYPKPKYDDAVTIYGDLFSQLDNAIQLITASNQNEAPQANTDVVFHGAANSKQLWLKFANTIKLRMLLRLTEMSSKPAYFATQAAKIKADQATIGFLGIGEGAMVNPGFSSTSNIKQNPFYHTFFADAAGNPSSIYAQNRAGAYGVNFYQNTNDPRLAQFYAPYSGNSYAGVDYGIQGLPNNYISAAGPGLFKSSDQPLPLLTSFESLFLQAEAAYRGLITGDYKTLYKQAVTESFDYFGIASQAPAYYSQTGNATLQNQVNIDLTPSPLATIITQKWASLNGLNILEPYADYRRLHLPADVPGSRYPNAGAIPYRLWYPASEYQTNEENVNAQGTITLHTKIFWMP